MGIFLQNKNSRPEGRPEYMRFARENSKNRLFKAILSRDLHEKPLITCVILKNWGHHIPDEHSHSPRIPM